MSRQREDARARIAAKRSEDAIARAAREAEEATDRVRASLGGRQIHDSVREQWLAITGGCLTGVRGLRAKWHEEAQAPAPSWWEQGTKTIHLHAHTPAAKDAVDQHAYSKGKLYHECFHVQFDGGKTLTDAFQEASRGDLAYKDQALWLLNVLDDGRIERQGARKTPGAQRYIDYVLRSLGEPTDAAGWLLRRVRGRKDPQFKRSCYGRFDSEIEAAVNAPTLTECARIAGSIFDLLSEADKAKMPQQAGPGGVRGCYRKNPERSGSGSGSGKGKGESKSEGKGEGSSEGSSKDASEDEGKGKGKGEGHEGQDQDQDKGDSQGGTGAQDGEDEEGGAEDGSGAEDANAQDGAEGTEDASSVGTSHSGGGRERKARQARQSAQERKEQEDAERVRKECRQELDMMLREDPVAEPQDAESPEEDAAAEEFGRFLRSMKWDAGRQRFEPADEGTLDSRRLVNVLTGGQYRRTLQESQGFEFATALLVDVSGSMQGQRFDVASSAARILNRALMDAELPVHIFAFASTAGRLTKAPATRDHRELMGQYGQGTEGQTAIDEAAKRLSEDDNPRKLILVVTDGGYRIREGMLAELEAQSIRVVMLEIHPDMYGQVSGSSVVGVGVHETVKLRTTEEVAALPQEMERLILEFAAQAQGGR